MRHTPLARFLENFPDLTARVRDLRAHFFAHALRLLISRANKLFLDRLVAPDRSFQGAAVASHLLAIPGELLTFLFQPLEHAFHLTLLLVLKLAGVSNDYLGEAEATSDLESQAASSGVLHQAVSGLVRFGIEFKRSGSHTGCVRCVGFEHAVMCRRQYQSSPSPKVLDQCGSQGSPFGGVGSRADLIEQYQGRLFDASFHLHDVPEVRRERGEARTDRLFVSDVREDLSEDGERAFGIRRNVEPRLCHQRKQPGRLECDRLATGIGTGEDENTPTRIYSER